MTALEGSVDDTILLDMEACFTAFDRNGYVCVEFRKVVLCEKFRFLKKKFVNNTKKKNNKKTTNNRSQNKP